MKLKIEALREFETTQRNIPGGLDVSVGYVSKNGVGCVTIQ
jgi:hypothetical protein